MSQKVTVRCAAKDSTLKSSFLYRMTVEYPCIFTPEQISLSTLTPGISSDKDKSAMVDRYRDTAMHDGTDSGNPVESIQRTTLRRREKGSCRPSRTSAAGRTPRSKNCDLSSRGRRWIRRISWRLLLWLGAVEVCYPFAAPWNSPICVWEQAKWERELVINCLNGGTDVWGE